MEKTEHFNLSKKLHTDVLEEKYGPVHSEIIRHDDLVREVDIVDEKGISRTHALTFFSFDRENNELNKIDEEIKNGGLIGKVFRDYGYEVRKNVIKVFLIDLSEELKKKMMVTDQKAKVRLSEFYAKKLGSDPFIYGVVSEIYSPDFRPAEINEVDIKQDNPITSAMERVGISKGVIWDQLGDGGSFSDIRESVDKAEILAEKEEEVLVQQVKTYIEGR